jgi:lysozyme family protein
MSDFALAIPVVLRHEGGYSNVEGDPGGNTNFGVSLRWLKGQGLLLQELEAQDHTQDVVQVIKQMTVQQAGAIYKQFWWDKYGYSDILGQALATKVFDTAVNVGATRSHKFLQAALNLPQDGMLGPNTLHAANSTNNITVLSAFQKNQAAYYQAIATANPKLEKFLNGWMNRAYDRA